MHAYIHTYVHTYIHTYVHTYIHTYSPRSICRKVAEIRCHTEHIHQHQHTCHTLGSRSLHIVLSRPHPAGKAAQLRQTLAVVQPTSQVHSTATSTSPAARQSLLGAVCHTSPFRRKCASAAEKTHQAYEPDLTEHERQEQESMEIHAQGAACCPLHTEEAKGTLWGKHFLERRDRVSTSLDHSLFTGFGRQTLRVLAVLAFSTCILEKSCDHYAVKLEHGCPVSLSKRTPHLSPAT